MNKLVVDFLPAVCWLGKKVYARLHPPLAHELGLERKQRGCCIPQFKARASSLPRSHAPEEINRLSMPGGPDYGTWSQLSLHALAHRSAGSVFSPFLFFTRPPLLTQRRPEAVASRSFTHPANHPRRRAPLLLSTIVLITTRPNHFAERIPGVGSQTT